MPTAHFVPSSLLMEEIAAIHGVYRRQNTRRDAADSGESTTNNVFVLPNNTESVETTLSFAINPAIKDVQIRQSPKPSGAKIGAIAPATAAKMLSFESATKLKCNQNVCKNHITRDAIKITVNAL